LEKLNYNSTPRAVKEAVDAGKLAPYRPVLAWAENPRVFLMTPMLDGQIRSGLASGDQSVVYRWDKLRADISHFVEGGLINWNLMRWLVPKKFEHWELRSVRPRPSLRVFGRFACPNVFVGTHVVARSLLKGKWAVEWELEKLRCEDHWKAALGEFQPFSADLYEGYITENASLSVRIEK
jgi:hypothetical protein